MDRKSAVFKFRSQMRDLEVCGEVGARRMEQEQRLNEKIQAKLAKCSSETSVRRLLLSCPEADALMLLQEDVPALALRLEAGLSTCVH